MTDKSSPYRTSAEKFFAKALKSRNINFVHNIYLDDYEVDFYIPKYNFLIEYQGEQHEKYVVGNFHRSEKDFIRQQEHDKRKREYAKLNDYNLLEVWYWDFNNIENILDTYLNDLTQQTAS
jgi:very-short-patch-repair endonuclease